MKTRIAVIVLLCSAAIGPGLVYGKSNLALLQELSDEYAELAARTTPGVVAIAIERVVTRRNNPFSGTPWGGPRFNQPQSQEEILPGSGSGVIVEHGGEHYILTNNHVVKEAVNIRVELADTRNFEAEVVGVDTLSDLAVLKVEAADLPAIPWGKSADLRVGEWVLAIGNPFGLEHSVSNGIVSALGRDRFQDDYGSFIQTDAAINPGNSGGALINVNGELVGINTAIISGRDRGNKGVGFAIPVDLALNVLDQIVTHGVVRRGYLGAGIRPLNADLAEALGMDNTQGVFIRDILSGGAAEKAGLEVGDVVLELNGERMRTSTQFRSLIGATAPGTKVTLLVLRRGKEKKIRAELEDRTESVLASAPAEKAEPEQTGSLGLRLRNLTREDAEKYGFAEDTGILISQVRKGSLTARANLRPGDLLVRINYEEIASTDDYERVVDKIEPGKAALFELRRGPQAFFRALRIPKNASSDGE